MSNGTYCIHIKYIVRQETRVLFDISPGLIEPYIDYDIHHKHFSYDRRTYFLLLPRKLRSGAT